MTERERLFCEAYATDPNATRAAKRAGFSEKTAYSQGSRLLKDVEVISYIRRLQEEQADARIVSMKTVRAFWCDTMRDTTQKMADRLRASELLAKSAGEFVHIERLDDGGAGVVAGEDVVVLLPDNNRDRHLQKYTTDEVDG